MCGCNHLTFFGGDFVVAPNTIDFDTVFGKFASNIGDNLAVLCTVIGLLVLYWLGLLLLRRMDKKDQSKVCTKPHNCSSSGCSMEILQLYKDIICRK